MPSAQAGLRAERREPAVSRGSARRVTRTRGPEAPLKKRLMAEMDLKRQASRGNPGAPRIKKERAEEDDEAEERREAGCERSGRRGRPSHLSPGLRHTLAQFTLSSQSSLGGPAAFSARGRQNETVLPPPPPPSTPVLAPCDSSTELTHALLEGEAISCFAVGGEKRLCLPQVLNSVLRHFSLQQINAVCDELYVYCSRCRADQLHVLKVLGVLPLNAPSCGLITLTDAQRLCNALLRSGHAPPPSPSPPPSPLKEGGGSFQVEHRCLGKGQGLFVGALYSRPDAACIQCARCRLLFSPPRFVMHSHRLPDRRTCHWGFDSARWPRYLQLARKYLGTQDEAPYKKLLEEMKEKFSAAHKKPLDSPRQGSCSIRSPSEKLQGGDPEEKASRYLYPDVKEEPDVTADDTHPSCFLYKFDEGEAAGVSPGKADGQVSVEVLRTLLKRHYSQESASKEVRLKLSLADVGRTFRRASGHEHRPRLVTTEMCQGEETCAALLDEDTTLEEGRDGMVPEIVQLYHRQQEVLNATLQKHKQLEAELAAVRRGRAPVRSELLTEPETVHAEDSLKEPATVETERAQKCTCASAAQSLPEAHYAVQLSELRRRLDRAEEDREELQEALRQEREAREKLELVIAQLRQQLSDSHPVSGRAAPGAAAVWS